MADMYMDMEVHMVANMEVKKVADMVADMYADIVAKKVPNLARRRRKGTQFGERIGHMGWLVNWAQTFLTQCLPGLRVF